MSYEDDELFPRKRGFFTFQDGLIIIASITVGAIIVYFLIKWIETNIRIPPPNYSLPQTPYWSPYPYSPYMPQPQPPCSCATPAPVVTPPTVVGTPVASHWTNWTQNAETWSVKRDKKGNISEVEVHRNVKEH